MRLALPLLLTSYGAFGATSSPVLGSLETCCQQGKAWGAVSEEECDGFPLPVKDIIPEMQQLCISAMEICCTQQKREEECSLGKSAALNGQECGTTDLTSRPEAKTFKDCCLACTLGITIASMSQKCTGVAGSFNEPWKGPFVACCEDYLDPLMNETLPTPSNNETTTQLTTELPSVKCPNGFVYNKNMHVCDDADECEGFTHDCLESEVCHNTVGSYVCEPDEGSANEDCPVGYQYFLISCIDINECEDTNPCKAEEICLNTEGSYKCLTQETYKENNSCPPGFQNSNGKCTDINECQTGDYNCLVSQRCDNTIGSYICVRHSTCGTGYTLNFDTGNCEDNDECALGTHNCGTLGPGYICRNIKGSFRCEKKRCNVGEILDENGLCAPISCGVGFEPGPSGVCMDIDECSTPNTCGRGEQCINTLGSYECLSNCELGLKLNYALGVCEDIDECAQGTAQCFHGAKCLNTVGSYRCSCDPGYKEVNGVCKDINECLLNGRFLCGIDSECQNSEGSYRCICKQGFQNIGRRCTDIDECAEIPDICGHRCENMYGSYRCRCDQGFELSSDMRSCVDIDECQENRCLGFCVNEPGSFSCKCPSGYRLSNDQRSCIDIDECVEDSPCRGADQYCHNTRGGYKCADVSCPPGYVKEQGQNNRCKRISTRCSSTDMACLKKPVSMSFNFMSIIASLQVASAGVDLFTMQSARYEQITTKFSLTLIDVFSGPGVLPATRNSFTLKTGVHQAILSLKESLQGPQEIELELLMEMYHRGRFSGAAIAKVFIFIGGYSY